MRQDQWVGLANTLIERLKSQNFLVGRDISLPDGTQVHQPPEVRYLTLPGLDYLDVRTQRIVALRWPLIEALADALTERGKLNGREIRAVMDAAMTAPGLRVAMQRPRRPART